MADKKGGKNRKYGRMEKWCAVYESSGRAEKNRKRRMQYHLRRNPGDQKAISRYEQTFGNASSVGLAAKGRKIARRRTVLPKVASG